jgi:ribosomal protein S18 acetylase RimI-like enzyme
MRKTAADLILRPPGAPDDAFIYRLSERIFAAYSIHPGGSMASMLAEGGAITRVAERGALPVGFFVVGMEHLGRSFGPWRRPAVARLNAIGVQPDLHGRGVGRFLLDHAEALARAEGAVSMTLMTAATNTRARRLFASAGFQDLLVVDRAYARGQRGVVMTKPLHDGAGPP